MGEGPPVTDNQYGPDKRCQRTACTTGGPADHLGGAHLDPHDRERFDGNVTSIRATTYRVRDAVQALHAATRNNPALALIADVAIHDTLEEIFDLGQQVAHVRVDADNRVREAIRRSGDCTVHGGDITDLEQQVDHFNAQHRRAENARLALLAEHQAISEFLNKFDTDSDFRDDMTVSRLVAALRATNKKTAAAHNRSWGST